MMPCAIWVARSEVISKGVRPLPAMHALRITSERAVQHLLRIQKRTQLVLVATIEEGAL
jgi:hypothetical protein